MSAQAFALGVVVGGLAIAVVWEDYRNRNWDIYGYDMGPDGIFGTSDDIGEFQITTDTKVQLYPAIYENIVVWEDYRNRNWDIYGYDMGPDGIFGTPDVHIL